MADRHPELHPKFDAMLALTFFSQANPSKGTQYAHSLIDHADSLLPPLYKEYAQATVLIAEENYVGAFQTALALQGKLDHEEYPILDAMNTLRLLFLADQLGDETQKTALWAKLEKHPAYPTIQTLFHEGNVSLRDYFIGNRMPLPQKR